jgi:glycine/D-amino acid oxidase-like deaminating enzyme
MSARTAYLENAREVPVVEGGDVVVCGGGPAGFAAAVAAARAGARTTLLEVHGCLGGVWTAGALAYIIDAGKPGIMDELIDRLDARSARAGLSRENFVYDVELMKLVLEEMVTEAGVTIQLHTRVVAAERAADGRLDVVLTESKSGRQAWRANVFVDATGDGDVAARAGCAFDVGHPTTGETQPMSLMAVLTGIPPADVVDFICDGRRIDGTARAVDPRMRLKELLMDAGCSPSYTAPTLWCIYDDLYALMANHEYGVSAFDAAGITQATLRARREVHAIVDTLRSVGGPWSGARLVSTGAQIGVREGRRVRGHYTVTEEDLLTGAAHPDAVCHVTFGADVHSLSKSEGGFLNKASTIMTGRRHGYDIPVRALIARDVDGLLLAGRCISGDFLAHSSYRVTGNAVAMGEAAGVTAALASELGTLPQEVPWELIESRLGTAGALAV